MKKKYLVYLVVSFLFSFFLQANAATNAGSQVITNSQEMIKTANGMAPGDSGFQVYPSNPNGVAMDVLYYEVKPGAVIEDEVVASNYSKKDLTIYLYPVDFVKKSDKSGEMVAAQEADPKLVVGKWTTLEQIDQKGFR